jgi:hypothetical protein
MGRPRKIKEEINGVDKTEVDAVIASFSVKIDANSGFPMLVIDPGSRIVKRIWSQEELDRHLNRGWLRNG